MTCVTKNEENCDFLNQLDATLAELAYDFEFGITDLCRTIGMSRTSLHRKITTCSGKSISIYIREFRLAKAYELLTNGRQPIGHIAYSVGFSDLAYFSRCFKALYGQSPTDLRKEI